MNTTKKECGAATPRRVARSIIMCAYVFYYYYRRATTFIFERARREVIINKQDGKKEVADFIFHNHQPSTEKGWCFRCEYVIFMERNSENYKSHATPMENFSMSPADFKFKFQNANNAKNKKVTQQR
jgi:hypothetical protein